MGQEVSKIPPPSGPGADGIHYSPAFINQHAGNGGKPGVAPLIRSSGSSSTGTAATSAAEDDYPIDGMPASTANFTPFGGDMPTTESVMTSDAVSSDQPLSELATKLEDPPQNFDYNNLNNELDARVAAYKASIDEKSEVIAAKRRAGGTGTEPCGELGQKVASCYRGLTAGDPPDACMEVVNEYERCVRLATKSAQ